MANGDEYPSTPELIILKDDDDQPDVDKRLKMQCIFSWCIKNFSSCELESGEELFSPIFSADSSGKTRWYLSIFPNGQTDHEEFISIHLISFHTTEEVGNAKLSCKVSIVDAESKMWHHERMERTYRATERFQFNTFVPKRKLFEEKASVLPEDKLTITCQICAYDESDIGQRTEVTDETQNSRHALLKNLSKDLKTFYKSGKFSDVTLNLKDGSLSAHKVILSARSPVFAQLLSDSSVIQLNISEFDKRTMEALLSYIYSGEIDVVSASLSLDLYEASKKYDVRELKESITPNKIFAQTEILNERFSYIWRVKNFSSINRSSGRMIYSDKFHVGPSNRLWSLALYFHNRSDDDDDINIGVYLNKLWTSVEKKSVSVHFKIYLTDKEGHPCFTIDTDKCYKQTNRYGFSSFIKRNVLLSEMKKYLPGDILTLCCDMKVCDGASLSKVEHSYSSTNTNLSDISDVRNLSDCFLDLFRSKKNCDVSVSSSKRKFVLHKSILCARSSVFSDFFQNLASELKPYTVDVSGITPIILELLFLFIYTGELELSCETAPDLYIAANHYKIPDVKAICSKFLKSNLTTSNAFKVMALCKTVDDTELRNLAKDVICEHADELIQNSQWQEFVRDHGELSTEILKSLAGVYRESKRRRLQ